MLPLPPSYLQGLGFTSTASYYAILFVYRENLGVVG